MRGAGAVVDGARPNRCDFPANLVAVEQVDLVQAGERRSREVDPIAPIR